MRNYSEFLSWFVALVAKEIGAIVIGTVTGFVLSPENLQVIILTLNLYMIKILHPKYGIKPAS